MAESPIVVALLVALCVALGIRYYKQRVADKAPLPQPAAPKKPKADPNTPYTLEQLRPFDGQVCSFARLSPN